MISPFYKPGSDRLDFELWPDSARFNVWEGKTSLTMSAVGGYHLRVQPHDDGVVGDIGGIQARASDGLELTGVGGINLFSNVLARRRDLRTSPVPHTVTEPMLCQA